MNNIKPIIDSEIVKNKITESILQSVKLDIEIIKLMNSTKISIK